MAIKTLNLLRIYNLRGKERVHYILGEIIVLRPKTQLHTLNPESTRPFWRIQFHFSLGYLIWAMPFDQRNKTNSHDSTPRRPYYLSSSIQIHFVSTPCGVRGLKNCPWKSISKVQNGQHKSTKKHAHTWDEYRSCARVNILRVKLGYRRLSITDIVLGSQHDMISTPIKPCESLNALWHDQATTLNFWIDW